MLPIPPALESQTALLYSRGSSHCWLASFQSRTTQPLRSSPITGPSTLLRVAPPLCPASVLSSSRGPPAWTSPLASGRQVPTFRARARCRVTPPCMPDVIRTAIRPPPDFSRANDILPVSTSSIRSRHFLSGSLTLVSLHRT